MTNTATVLIAISCAIGANLLVPSSHAQDRFSFQFTDVELKPELFEETTERLHDEVRRFCRATGYRGLAARRAERHCRHFLVNRVRNELELRSEAASAQGAPVK